MEVFTLPVVGGITVGAIIFGILMGVLLGRTRQHAAQQHAQTLETSLQQQRAELQQAQAELQQSQKELQEASSALRQTREDVQRKHAEARQSQEQLQQSQASLQQARQDFLRLQEESQQSQTALRRREEELEAYRGNVAQHFTQTAVLFQSLTANYRVVYEHLAAGAQTLCEGKVLALTPDALRESLLPAPPEEAHAEEASSTSLSPDSEGNDPSPNTEEEQAEQSHDTAHAAPADGEKTNNHLQPAISSEKGVRQEDGQKIEMKSLYWEA